MAMTNDKRLKEYLISPELQRLRAWLILWLQELIQHSGMTTLLGLQVILRLLSSETFGFIT